MKNQKVVILGLGNPLFSDEGVGIHLIHSIKSFVPEGIECVDGGTDGLGLLRIVEQADKLLVLDAVDAAEKPGTVVQLSGGEIPMLERSRLSQHQLGLQEVLALAEFKGQLPREIDLIGIQPHSLEWGCQLSETVSAQLPNLFQKINCVLHKWGFAGLFGKGVVANNYSDLPRQNPLVGAGLRVVVEHSAAAGVNSR